MYAESTNERLEVCLVWLRHPWCGQVIPWIQRSLTDVQNGLPWTPRGAGSLGRHPEIQSVCRMIYIRLASIRTVAGTVCLALALTFLGVRSGGAGSQSRRLGTVCFMVPALLAETIFVPSGWSLSNGRHERYSSFQWRHPLN